MKYIDIRFEFERESEDLEGYMIERGLLMHTNIPKEDQNNFADILEDSYDFKSDAAAVILEALRNEME